MALFFTFQENGIKFSTNTTPPLNVAFRNKLKQYPCLRNPSSHTLNLLKGACYTTLTTSVGSLIWQLRLQQQHFQDPSLDVCSEYIAALSTFCVSTAVLLGCATTYKAVTNDKTE